MIPSTYQIPSERSLYNSLYSYTCGASNCTPGNFVATSGKFNAFVESLFKHWETRFALTQTTSTLDNASYDEVLSKNIVFLALQDAAGVNTVVECIARATPFLVNRNCGVLEVLPSNYPLYYDTLEEAARLATDFDAIQRAHFFLLGMDKTSIHIDTFMSELVAFLQYIAV